ncbi:hypothetical protein [Solidesulfovibrio sp. C21]|uniref:hypothetical protein n=1 Tax=Solidesulfovibrio sp. C21 TaxID=3398613 RepID=UPI0039FB932E
MAIFLRKQWRQKPPESWQIDWGHPLADGLASFITADGDHVSGYPLVLMGAAKRQGDGTIYSPGSSTDGAYVDFNPLILNIKTDFSIIVFHKINVLPSWSHLFSIPINTTYAGTQVAIDVCQYYDQGKLLLGYKTQSTEGKVVSPGNYISTTRYSSCIAACKSNSSVLWYRDGNFSNAYSFFYSSSLDIAPDFSNHQPITISNHSSTSPGEATGGVFGPTIVYSKMLSADALNQLNENPWQIFAPRRLYCALSVTSSPSAGARVTAARMAHSAGTAQARPIVAGSPAAPLLHPAAPATAAEVATKGATVATHLAAVVNAGAPHGAARAAVAPAMSAVVARTGLSAFASALAEALPAFLGATPGEHTGTPIAIVVPDAVQAALAARAVAAAAATTAGATACVLRLLARSLAGDIVIREVARLASPITTTVRRASAVAVAIRLASPIETEQA